MTSGGAAVKSLFQPFADMGRLFAQLWRFMWVRKSYWMIPIVVVLLVLLVLIVVSQTPVGPFIYTLF